MRRKKSARKFIGSEGFVSFSLKIRGSGEKELLVLFNYSIYIYFLARSLAVTHDITCASRMEQKPFDLIYTDYYGTFNLEDDLGPTLSHYRYKEGRQNITSPDPLGYASWIHEGGIGAY